MKKEVFSFLFLSNALLCVIDYLDKLHDGTSKLSLSIDKAGIITNEYKNA